MGLRFQRRIPLSPHAVAVLSRSGLGVSVGAPGVHAFRGLDGRTIVTTSAPGTGLGYRSFHNSGNAAHHLVQANSAAANSSASAALFGSAAGDLAKLRADLMLLKAGAAATVAVVEGATALKRRYEHVDLKSLREACETSDRIRLKALRDESTKVDRAAGLALALLNYTEPELRAAAADELAAELIGARLRPVAHASCLRALRLRVPAPFSSRMTLHADSLRPHEVSLLVALARYWDSGPAGVEDWFQQVPAELSDLDFLLECLLQQGKLDAANQLLDVGGSRPLNALLVGETHLLCGRPLMTLRSVPGKLPRIPWWKRKTIHAETARAAYLRLSARQAISPPDEKSLKFLSSVLKRSSIMKTDALFMRSAVPYRPWLD